jgi:Flp pilus assembly pilin Flp
MQFDQFRHLDEGSNAVGFALIAPLIIGVFLATLQIANLVNVQTTLNSAANAGARVASRYDGNLSDGLKEANEKLANQGIAQFSEIRIDRVLINGISFIEIRINKEFEVPWIGYSIMLNSVGRSVEEKIQ